MPLLKTSYFTSFQRQRGFLKKWCTGNYTILAHHPETTFRLAEILQQLNTWTFNGIKTVLENRLLNMPFYMGSNANSEGCVAGLVKKTL